MPIMIRPLSIKVHQLIILIIVPLLVACTIGPEQAADGPELEACQLEGILDARCGMITVPEDRDNPAGNSIDIHFAVVPAESSLPAPDPVFMLAGGPGQAATEAYPFIVMLFDALHQNRDIVLVDQRGTGQSNPLQCPALYEMAMESSEEEVTDALQECREELEQQADLDEYTTDVAMQDLDDVRQALGYEQINLIGVSYGSRAALMYMRMFPENVRSVVLDAVVSPELVLQLQAPADGQRALELLFERCQQDEACRETFPDFSQQFAEVRQQLEGGREVTFQHPLSGAWEETTLNDEEWMQGIFNLLYSPDLVSLLPLTVEQIAETGDYGPLVAQIMALTADLRSYQGMFYAVTCSEDAPFIDMEEAEALQSESSFPLMAELFVTNCEGWPTAEVPEGLREPLNSDIPTLLLSGEADPITPPRYAEQVAEGLTNSEMITLPDYGHGILSVGCVPAVVTAFIEAGTPEGLDTSCTEEITPPPFFVSPAGPRP